MTSRLASLIAVFLSALSLLPSCGGKQDKPVPRRQAYPRIAIYDTVYRAADSVPMLFEINAQAKQSVQVHGDTSVWLTVDYPDYNAKILCTFTYATASSTPAIVDNRAERIRLNLGGASADIDQSVTNAGYSVTIVSSPSVAHMPVQFLAAPAAFAQAEAHSQGQGGWIVSGAAFFPAVRDGAPIDSLAPMSATLKRDIAHALESMDSQIKTPSNEVISDI